MSNLKEFFNKNIEQRMRKANLIRKDNIEITKYHASIRNVIDKRIQQVNTLGLAMLSHQLEGIINIDKNQTVDQTVKRIDNDYL